MTRTCKSSLPGILLFLCVLLLTPAAGRAQSVLFQDTFGRADSRNVDGATGGITDNTGVGASVDGVYLHGFIDPNNDDPTNGAPDGNGSNGGGAQVLGNQLELADGAGTANVFVDRNFTSASILAAGGFSVSVDVTAYNDTTSGQGGGFAVGMSRAGALDAGDALNGTGSTSGNDKMQDGFTGGGNTENDVAVSDFWVLLRGDGTLIWGGAGNSVSNTQNNGSAFFGQASVGSKTGTIQASFAVSSFAQNSTVYFEVYFNGVSQGSGSFLWDEGNANYIGLDARDSGGVFFDNLSITEAPPFLFQDTFDRADSRNVDGATGGITDNTGVGASVDGVYVHGFIDPNNDDPTNGAPDGDLFNGGGAQILGNELELADGSGTANVLVDRNFTNASILAAGGFSVSVDVTAYDDTTSAKGGGLAVGMSRAAALDTGDALNGIGSTSNNDKMQDGIAESGNTENDVAVSDFWVFLRGDGTLIWGGAGNSVSNTQNNGSAFFGQASVGSKTGTIQASFAVSSFDQDSRVNFVVYFNGVGLGTGSFLWDGGDANYVGLDARDDGGVFFDNLTIAVTPASVASVASIPTLSEWGMIILIGLVVLLMGRRVFRTPLGPAPAVS